VPRSHHCFMPDPRSPEPKFNRQSDAELRASRRSAATEGAGVALALGGGFARGFAHLGVLDVLEQERIPVSAIAGTSIGGLLGAAYADGFSIRELCDLGRQVRVRDLIRFNRSSVIAPGNDRIGQFVREWFHAGRVEELCIPTAIVTTDIDTCAAQVFTRGPLEVAIRATCAFPGLFLPVEYEGRRLADGCIVAPVPTEVAARMSALCVLGVSVNSTTTAASSFDEARRQRDPAARTSRPGEGFAGAQRNNWRREPSWSQRADLLLEPDVQGMDWDDFANLDQAHDAGVKAMRRALSVVRELLDRRSALVRPAESSGLAQRSGMAS
jgi:NTE family protein